MFHTLRLRNAILLGLAGLALLLASGLPSAHGGEERALSVPILVYHRFGTVAADSMTVTTGTFESHLAFLHENGFTVIPLRALIDFLRGEGPPPPPRAVVITADDGHRSVYSEMFPLVRRYGVPVTLFIYPSAISNATYALTWAQLGELARSGLVDVQSHTYWHPHFGREKRRLPAEEYDRLVDSQLSRAKQVLEGALGRRVDILAWPFGIHDEQLEASARSAGYVAALSLDRRHVRRTDRIMALPRYLITNSDQGRAFARIFSEAGDE